MTEPTGIVFLFFTKLSPCELIYWEIRRCTTPARSFVLLILVVLLIAVVHPGTLQKPHAHLYDHVNDSATRNATLVLLSMFLAMRVRLKSSVEFARTRSDSSQGIRQPG